MKRGTNSPDREPHGAFGEGRRDFDTRVLYFDDEAASGDSLAWDTLHALAELPQDEGRKWPDTRKPVGPALYGKHCAAPSIVWHSHALAALLEVGFGPSAQCIGSHLRILERRLDPAVARSPEDYPDDPFVLRTRHVALALDAMAEFDAGAFDEADLSPERVQRHRAHESAAQRALKHLMGEGADWIGISDERPFWPEYWGSKRPNLLNTLYSSIAVVRAHRHGLQVVRPSGPSWDGTVTVEETVRRFIELVGVEPTKHGPRTRIGGGWVEPWSKRSKLPCSIVGLLALLLLEYESLLVTQRASEWMARRARHARVLSTRLGNELVARAKEWTSSIDAFSYGQPKWWYVPAHSICLRAVLATHTAGLGHRAVRAANATIDASSRKRPYGETWVDPTRAVNLDARVKPDQASNWFARHDISSLVRQEQHPATASSIYAAVMGLAAIQRAAGRRDPRRLYEAPVESPASPFTHVEISRIGNASWELIARAHDGYAERVRVREGIIRVLEVLAEKKRATGEQIATTVKQRVVGRPAKAPRTPDTVRRTVESLNKRFGVPLVEKRPLRSNNYEYTLNAVLTKLE